MARKARPLATAFWTDDKVAHLSRDARLTLIGLITKCADDEGRFVATINTINGELYPYDDIAPTKVKRWMDEIQREGMVLIYRVNGGTYGWLPKWSVWQKPPHPTKSTLPGPTEEALFS